MLYPLKASTDTRIDLLTTNVERISLQGKLGFISQGILTKFESTDFGQNGQFGKQIWYDISYDMVNVISHGVWYAADVPYHNCLSLPCKIRSPPPLELVCNSYIEKIDDGTFSTWRGHTLHSHSLSLSLSLSFYYSSSTLCFSLFLLFCCSSPTLSFSL